MTDTSDPSRIMMRQVAGSFAQNEKARLVHKLAAAPARKKALTGRCGGRKPLAELRPEVAALAREMPPRPGDRPAALWSLIHDISATARNGVTGIVAGPTRPTTILGITDQPAALIIQVQNTMKAADATITNKSTASQSGMRFVGFFGHSIGTIFRRMEHRAV